MSKSETTFCELLNSFLISRDNLKDAIKQYGPLSVVTADARRGFNADQNALNAFISDLQEKRYA